MRREQGEGREKKDKFLFAWNDIQRPSSGKKLKTSQGGEGDTKGTVGTKKLKKKNGESRARKEVKRA